MEFDASTIAGLPSFGLAADLSGYRNFDGLTEVAGIKQIIWEVNQKLERKGGKDGRDTEEENRRQE